MFKKLLLSAVLISSISVPSFADIEDIILNYDSVAIAQNKDKIDAVRSSIYDQEFLVDKFIKFYKVQNALDLLQSELEKFDKDSFDYRETVETEVGSGIFVPIAIPTIGALTTFNAVVDGMRNLTPSNTATLQAALAAFVPTEISTAMTTLSTSLGDIDFLVSTDATVRLALESAVSSLQDIAGDINDATYLAMLGTEATEIDSILTAPPLQSIYAILSSAQAATDAKVQDLEKRINFLVRLAR